MEQRTTDLLFHCNDANSLTVICSFSFQWKQNNWGILVVEWHVQICFSKQTNDWIAPKGPNNSIDQPDLIVISLDNCTSKLYFCAVHLRSVLLPHLTTLEENLLSSPIVFIRSIYILKISTDKQVNFDETQSYTHGPLKTKHLNFLECLQWFISNNSRMMN